MNPLYQKEVSGAEGKGIVAIGADSKLEVEGR